MFANQTKFLLLFALAIAEMSVFNRNSEAQPSSAEGMNPFSRYTSGAGQVSEYTGDATYSIPITAVSGRGGVSLPIALRYSSNIYHQVRARNDIAPTSWVGLGWQLGFGFIATNHKGTTTIDDDEYVYNTGGATQKILYGNDRWYLERSPYTKVERIVSSTNAWYVEGWILTDISGGKQKFGNLSITPSPNATWHTFCWPSSGHVGSGSSGTPQQYPNRWDFSRVEDAAGNGVAITYHQENKPVKVGMWEPTALYTRESYPEVVKADGGGKVEFERATKHPDEYFDPHTLVAEPDGIMEVYDTCGLQRIREYNDKDVLLRTWTLTYRLIQLGMPPHAAKRLPVKIELIAGSEYQIPYTLRYFDNIAKATAENSLYDPEYNYGALCEVITNTGGKTVFEYERKVLAAVSNTFDYGTRESGEKSDRCDLNMGTITDGYEYGVFSTGPDNRRITVKQWDGNAWIVPKVKMMYTGEVIDFTALTMREGDPGTGVLANCWVYAGHNFLVIKGGTSASRIWVFNWDGTAWVETVRNKRFDVMCGVEEKEVFVGTGNDYITIVTGWNRDRVFVLRWDGNEWIIANVRLQTRENGAGGVDQEFKCMYMLNTDGTAVTGDKTINIQPTPYNYFIVTGDYASDRIWVFNWDGTKWVEELAWTILPSCGEKDKVWIFPGPDYFVGIGCANEDVISAYRWTGVDWEVADVLLSGATTPISFNGLRMQYQGGGDYPNMKFDCRTSGDFFLVFPAVFENRTRLWAFNWDGEKFVETIRQNAYACGHAMTKIAAGPGYFATVQLRSGAGRTWSAVNWENNSWVPNLECAGNGDGQDYAVTTANNHFVLSSGTIQGLAKIIEYIYDGMQWSTTGGISRQCSGDRFMRTHQVSTAGNATGILFLESHEDESPTGDVYYMAHKLQDKIYGTIVKHTVSSVTSTDMTQGKQITTKYEYANDRYDTHQGGARFNKVTAELPGRIGKQRNWYYNDTDIEGQAENPNYLELDGMLYRSETYACADATCATLRKVAESRSAYSVYRVGTWPAAVLTIRPVSQQGTKDGVTSKSETLQFNILNGLPSLTRTFGSDGKALLKETHFAFLEPTASGAAAYPGMFTKNMLALPSTVVIYENAANTEPYSLAASCMRGAQATTYSEELGAALPIAHKAYTWKADFAANGTPDKVFDYFKHYPGATNANWIAGGSTERVTGYGQPIETKDAAGTHSAVLLSANSTYPLLKVSNARQSECLFTNWAENGPSDAYRIATEYMSSSAEDLHFAPRTLKVTASDGLAGDHFATFNGQEMGSLKDKSFSIEFWAKADRSTKSYVYLQGLTTWATTPVQNFSLSTDWQKYSFDGNTFGSNAENDTRYRLVLRPPCDNGFKEGTVYYDDVRVTPKGALATTTYYDQKWRTPILTLDVNNLPGDIVTIDELGRPVRAYKVDGKYGPSTTAFKILRQEKQYHIAHELPAGVALQVNSPGTSEVFKVGDQVQILWASNDNTTVTITCEPGATPVTTSGLTNYGYGSYTWTVPSSAVGTGRSIRLTRDGAQAESPIFTVTN